MLGVLAQPAFAQSVPTGEPGVHRLSDAERERILNAGTEESVDAAQARALGGGGGQIHGEVSAMIGSDGARGVAATALVPLGQNGFAVLNVENSRYGRIRHR